MHYKVNYQLTKLEYDNLSTTIQASISNTIHKRMLHDLIEKMPFDELREIRKIQLLEINPFIINGFNGNKPLFKAEIAFMRKVKALNVIHYEVHILTNTGENGTEKRK